MAIIPSEKYPQQILLDAAYPQGKARNTTMPGDGTGTPLEADWLNDLFGFEQALLDAAGIEPSRVPDSVDQSQYLQAIEKLIDDDVDPVKADLDTFESQPHAWTDTNSFAAAVTMGSDVSVAGTVTLSGALDANGNVNISQHVTLDGATNRIKYSSPRGSQFVIVPATQINGDWERDATLPYAISCDVAGGEMSVQIRVPSNGTLTGVLALATQGHSGASSPVSIAARKLTIDGSSAPDYAIIAGFGAAAVHSGSAGDREVIGGVTSEAWSKDDALVILLTASDTANSTADRIEWVAAYFDLDGPPVD
jgi:hypothetical protein